MSTDPLILVVTLTVRSAALESFRSFERQAARIMARYGGAIERTVVIQPDRDGAPLKEVHIVTFPDPQAFKAYQSDAELQMLQPLRAASVLQTDVLVGEEGPDYR